MKKPGFIAKLVAAGLVTTLYTLNIIIAKPQFLLLAAVLNGTMLLFCLLAIKESG